MQYPDLKALKKLADTCRKAGIKHYKTEHFEFTLTEDAPVSNYKKSQQNMVPADTSNKPFESDSLSDDELLFWSTGNPADNVGSEDSNG